MQKSDESNGNHFEISAPTVDASLHTNVGEPISDNEVKKPKTSFPSFQFPKFGKKNKESHNEADVDFNNNIKSTSKELDVGRNRYVCIYANLRYTGHWDTGTLGQ